MKNPVFAFLRSRIQGEDWPQSWKLPRWQAHRGYHLEGAPENTLASLRAAKDRGALMAEFDVRLTKDQIPVLFHDADVSGKNRSDWLGVTDLWQVLTSADVPFYLNIEIKSEQVWNDPLERKVVGLIKKAGVGNRVLFSSFNPFSIWKLQSLAPDIPRALLVAKDMDNQLLREMALAPFLKLHAVHLERSLLENADDIYFWQRKNLKVATWTVNEQDAIRRFLQMGVDSVITDLIPEQRKST